MTALVGGGTVAPAWSLAALLVGAALALAPSAEAQSGADAFQAAREAYTRGAYQEVVSLLEPMVGGEVPSSDILDDNVLVRESRKYLGAAYLLTGHRRDAERQFEALLQALGTDLARYHLDPAAFPPDVHEAFEAVRESLLVRMQGEGEELARAQRLREARRREAVLRLVGMAEEAEVLIENPFLLAWLPFGIGQFQNGDDELGTFFAISETLFCLSASATLAAYLNILAQHERSLVFEGPRIDTSVLEVLSYLNWISVGAAGVTMLAGVIESVVRYVPTRRVRRRNQVPPEILQDLELGLSPGGLTLGARF